MTPVSKMDMYYGAAEARGGRVCGRILVFLSCGLFLATLPLSLFFCIKVVRDYERLIVFRLGHVCTKNAKGPGVFLVLPFVERAVVVDLRWRVLEVAPQQVLTKDSVSIAVDAVIHYRIANAIMEVISAKNAHHATRLLAQTTLRGVLGSKTLEEILIEREAISHIMQESLDQNTQKWGITVQKIEVKSVRLPSPLHRAMAAEATATTDARVKVIISEGEEMASQSYEKAANLLKTSPVAIHLRYLQTLRTVAAEHNSTIIFPLPLQMLGNIDLNDVNKNQKI